MKKIWTFAVIIIILLVLLYIVRPVIKVVTWVLQKFTYILDGIEDLLRSAEIITRNPWEVAILIIIIIVVGAYFKDKD